MPQNPKLATAQQLIQEKNYAAARALLETMGDDITAQRWLQQLDQIAPKKAVTRTKKSIAAVRIEPSPEQTFMIICPKCGRQNSQNINMQLGTQILTCPKCKLKFTTSVYNIRASSSRAVGPSRRDYSVRVIGSVGNEQQLNFSTTKSQHLELRSKDIAAFSYRGSKLKVVQNFTIAQYWKISTGCLLIILSFTAITLFTVWGLIR